MRLNARPIRIFSLLVLVALTNVYVFANGALANSSSALLGKLVTTSNRPVMVNGAEAITGSVILSGTRLTTSPVSLATVKINNVGTVTVAPGSDVLLTFDAHSINVKVMSGDAVANTVEGVTGTVAKANGAATPTSAAPAGGNSAKNWGIAGVAIGGGAFIWAIIAWNKAGNAEDDANAAIAANAALASQLAALRTCLAGQTTSPVKLCTSF